MSLGSAYLRNGKPQDAIQNYQSAAARYEAQKYFSEQVEALQEIGEILSLRIALRFSHHDL